MVQRCFYTEPTRLVGLLKATDVLTNNINISIVLVVRFYISY